MYRTFKNQLHHVYHYLNGFTVAWRPRQVFIITLTVLILLMLSSVMFIGWQLEHYA